MPPRESPPLPAPEAAAETAEETVAKSPSKTRRKQLMHELQQLGEALTTLTDERLAALPIAESLRDAVLEWRRTRSHEGRRRQMQYIGKLMRQADAEPIREAIASSQLGGARETLALHNVERWRDALLADDDAVTRWATQHPAGDVPQLRRLIRSARQDALAPAARGQATRQGHAYRELFRYLKAHSSDG